jgi:hypothetical protein
MTIWGADKATALCKYHVWLESHHKGEPTTQIGDRADAERRGWIVSRVIPLGEFVNVHYKDYYNPKHVDEYWRTKPAYASSRGGVYSEYKQQ